MLLFRVHRWFRSAPIPLGCAGLGKRPELRKKAAPAPNELKDHLQTELQLPGRAHGSGERPSSRHQISVAAVDHCRSWSSEVGTVEEVEEVRAEFHPLPFGKPEREILL